MSHDLATHRNFYRLPNEAIHLAKLSRLLMAMDNGTISDFYGKALEDIDVNVCVSEIDDLTEPPDHNKNIDLGNEEELWNEQYIPGPSTSHDSNEMEGNTNNNRKASRPTYKVQSTPPKGKQNKKATWDTPERHVARQNFKKY